GMSVRGEQFWLDSTRAAQLRPRSRPRYTLTPSIVLRDGQPFMAIGTPGGDNQDQTILQAFLNVVEFWNDWYPNLHEAFEWVGEPVVPELDNVQERLKDRLILIVSSGRTDRHKRLAIPQHDAGCERVSRAGARSQLRSPC